MTRRNRLSSTMMLFALITIGGAAIAEDETPPPPDVGVAAREVAGARIVEAVLPGRLLDSAVSSTGTVSSSGAIALLVAPEAAPDGPRSLYRFDSSGDGSLIELARDLPAELDTIELLDLGGDSASAGQTLVAGEPGRLYSLGDFGDSAAAHKPRLLLETPGLAPDRLSRAGLISNDRVYVPRPLHGRLDVYHWQGRDTLEQATTLALPVRTRRVRTGLVLSAPAVQILEREGQRPLLVIGPEPQGKRRLVTTLVDELGDPDKNEAGGEAWTRFSNNERIAQSWYLEVDGRPMLAVAALSADKLGIFEKKKLRIFPLRTDRTRAGSPPALEIETATRNWYDLGVHVTDLDDDGRDDLVVIQPDGLGAKKLAVEAYRGKGTGGFFITPRRSVVVAPDAQWAYGEDLDGDRVADLVAATGDRVLAFRGLGTAKKKLVVEKTPHWSIDAGLLGADTDVEVEVRIGSDADTGIDDESDHDWDPKTQPQVIDLDGNGRGEILLHGEVGGRAVVRVIELR